MQDGFLIPIDSPASSDLSGDELRYINIKSTSGIIPDVGLHDKNTNRKSNANNKRLPNVRLGDTSGLPESESLHSDESSGVIDVVNHSQQSIETSAGSVWVSGNSVLCCCPTCSAPMSVRLWLMVADCWDCETAIELTPEQQRAVEQLLEQNSDRPKNVPRHIESRDANRLELPVPMPASTSGFSLLPSIDTDSVPAAPQTVSVGDSRLTARLVRRAFSSLPAWLVSFLLHLILLLILALILLPQITDMPSITISTFVSPDDNEGGMVRVEDPDFELEDDVPLAQELAEGDDEARDVLEKAKEDAKELIEDPLPAQPRPDLDTIKDNITNRSGPLRSFAARDPRVRAEIVKKEGGTTLTEAAVSRGLRWLASVQNEDGSWSLKKYHQSSRSQNKGDMAATSLALLPFLGAGQTHEHGKYKENVTKGLLWILEHQKENGDLRDYESVRAGRMPENAAMYAHGQASIVLVEAFAMTGDERFRSPCERAIKFIEKAQHRQGGWRYQPKMSGDTSVFGWQLMALQSARSSQLGIPVDQSTVDLADQYLDRVGREYSSRGDFADFPSGALYRYLPNDREPSETMTAEAILCRMYLGWRRDNPRLSIAVKFLTDLYPPKRSNANIYYWYYATQALHHHGGRSWEKWNTKMREVLVLMQERRGRYPGSWDPGDFEWGGQGGRIFVTALAVCTLEVYYRHLPLFKQIDLE